METELDLPTNGVGRPTVRHRAGIAGAAVALLLTGACGTGADESEPRAIATPATPSAADEPLPCVAGVEPFTGPAAEAFGADGVMDAYCWLVDLAVQQARTSLGRPVPDQRPADLAPVREMLSEDAVAGWDRLVAARASGVGAESRRLDGLTLHDVRRLPAGYETEPDGPYLYGTRSLPGTAAPARGGEALRISFETETSLVLRARGDDSGRHSLLPVTRTASYVLVPDGDGWLVDDWRADFEQGEVRLVSR